MYILISQQQIRAIQAQLEFVTNQFFEFKIVQNDDKNLLCSWHNETHIDYLLHVMALGGHAYQVAFAVQKFRNIETRFDRRLEHLEANRLFNDPRQCVRYMVGQIRD